MFSIMSFCNGADIRVRVRATEREGPHPRLLLEGEGIIEAEEQKQ